MPIVYGAVWIAVGLAVIGLHLRVRRRSAEVDAVVVELRRVRVDHRDVYQPVVRFHEPSGRERVVAVRERSLPARHHPGERVRVLVDPEHPREVHFAGWRSTATLAAAAFGVGLFLILQGVN